MSYIENAKTYTGRDLETIFFRPMLSGPSALELGVRVLYNMPVPTTVQVWEGQKDILQKYTTSGWTGGKGARKLQKTIVLNKVKAELGFAASDYFSKVYELITGRADVNMDDLTGTELEQAETTLFKQAIAEGIRATMWVGDTAGTKGFNTFNGFLKTIAEYLADEALSYALPYNPATFDSPDAVVAVFENLWTNADDRLKDLRAEGQLAFFVTSDMYHFYEKYLDQRGAESAYTEMVGGRPSLAYHGIPLVDVRLGSYLKNTSFPSSFCLLTDRRNLVLAVNTSDFPGNEIRMWYNPDLMENRQRAVFMAGCDILDEAMLTFAFHKKA